MLETFQFMCSESRIYQILTFFNRQKIAVFDFFFRCTKDSQLLCSENPEEINEQLYNSDLKLVVNAFSQMGCV